MSDKASDSNYRASIKFIGHTRAFPFNRIEDYKKHCTKIDLALLGIGEDGHIASIFPDLLNSVQDGYFVRISNSPKMPPVRHTITPNFLNDCVDSIVFLVPPADDGKIKDVEQPDNRILNMICKNITVVLKKKS